MNASSHPATTATPSRAPEARDASAPFDDDLALGWECANPALQIEVWDREAAQPSQAFN